MKQFFILSLCFFLVACNSGSSRPETQTAQAASYEESTYSTITSPRKARRVASKRDEPPITASSQVESQESDAGTSGSVGPLRTVSPQGEPMSEQRYIGVDDILAQLRTATLALTAPKAANISEDVPVKLLVNLEKTQEALIEELEADEHAQIVSGDVQISKTMSATISAPDFDVSTVTPTRQAITSPGSTEWLWTLRPKAPGGHHVSITLVAHVLVDGERVEKHIKTFEETLTIEITTKQRFENFIKAYWQWLMSTLLIPLVLGGWKFYQSKKIKQQNS